jgi:hypothetical protein
MKTKSKVIILISVVVFLGLLLGAYLALIYVPTWYRPEYVDPANQQTVRDNFTDYSMKFHNGMQHLKSFEYSISAKDINQFISGVGYLRPEWKEAIPSNVNDPAVQLENDYLKVGAVVEQDGKKVFASFWLKVTPLENWLVIDDLSAKIGLYPVPREMMEKQITRISGKIERYFPFIKDILEKGQIPNRFKCPDASYDFRIKQMRAIKGVLYLTIEPIPRERK